MKLASALFFLAALGAPRAARADWFASDCGPLDAATERVLRDFERSLDAPSRAGLSVGVVRDACMLWKRAFGLADPETRIAMQTDSLSRIGSVTKTVTAVLLLRLVEEGTVALDDPVVRHLPEFSGVQGRDASTVTLRQLGSHTSGLPVKNRDPSRALGPLAEWSANTLGALSRTSLVSRPGRRYRYSNLGTSALGLALERAAGRPYVEIVREKVLAPLGMTRTTFFVPPEERRAPSLALSPHAAREHDGRGNRVPAGGLYSTVEELGRFAAALYGAGPDGFLSEASLRSQATPVLEASRYGLGVEVGTLHGRRTLRHAGGITGYRSALLVAPDARVGVVILQASGGGEPSPSTLAHRLLAPLLRRATSDRAPATPPREPDEREEPGQREEPGEP